MTINSRNKGKNGELELAQILRDWGFSRVRRSQQYAGYNGDADLVGLPHIHVEVKRVERLNIHDAIEQANRDSEKTGEIPAVFHRKNHTDWIVTMNLEDWVKLYEIALKHGGLDED